MNRHAFLFLLALSVSAACGESDSSPNPGTTGGETATQSVEPDVAVNSTCAATLCGPGTRCEESAGGARCVPTR